VISNNSFKNNTIALLTVLVSGSTVLLSQSAELTEQEKRDLFLKVRNQSTTEQKQQPTVRKSIPNSHPPASPTNTRPPQQQRPQPTQPAQQKTTQSRFGHQGTTTNQPRPAQTVRPPQPQRPADSDPAPTYEEEEGPGFRGTIRNIFTNARDRIQGLPRTSQSRGDVTQQFPVVIVPGSQPTAPSIKNGPAPQPQVPVTTAKKKWDVPPAPKQNTEPLRHAFPAEDIAKALDHNIDLDDPMINNAIKRAEQEAKKLVQENPEKVAKLKETALAAAATKTAPKKSVPSMGTSLPQQIAVSMTGSVFERFARQAMAMSMTTMVRSDSDADATAAEMLALETSDTSDADEKPEYVKATERMIQKGLTMTKKPKETAAPSLNDFIISAEHQTDLDIKSSSMTFAGSVIVESSRMHLTCDKFVVHMRQDRKGMSYGEALGNVVINMLENGKPTGNVAFAKKAIYRPDAGDVTLSGYPRIQQAKTEIVAATADTIIILNTNGGIKTEGRVRTILRQGN
jgi:lipopolysaccharide transport protein LptA